MPHADVCDEKQQQCPKGGNEDQSTWPDNPLLQHTLDLPEWTDAPVECYYYYSNVSVCKVWGNYVLYLDY